MEDLVRRRRTQALTRIYCRGEGKLHKTGMMNHNSEFTQIQHAII